MKHPDSIAEHVFRTMQIAYIMAKLEKVSDSELLELLEISLFHDNAESEDQRHASNCFKIH